MKIQDNMHFSGHTSNLRTFQDIFGISGISGISVRVATLLSFAVDGKDALTSWTLDWQQTLKYN
jgi:hypothetical protein